MTKKDKIMTKKRLVIAASILVIIVIVVLVILPRGNSQVVTLETKVVTSGTIVNTVTATGTIEPTDKVEVGTQVSGVINNLYVDFNSRVKKGQLLAELDKSTLKARLLQSQANLSSAQNEMTFQEQTYNRTKKLFETSMVSEVDFETAQYKYNNAKTAVDRLVSELNQAEVNLSYASIFSPIDGVILARNVEEGQTVAASFNTPTLFSIAKDLTKMQVEANVDEADIGQVRVDQRVTFTVDAYPEDSFNGKVVQIRLNPTVASNVVTYKVIVEAPNPDLKLMPGLTASISIITKEAANVLVVLAKSLQFIPDQTVADRYMPKFPSELGSPEQKGDLGIVNASDGSVRPEGMNQANSPLSDKNGEATVWIKTGNTIKPQIVKTGLTDGLQVEILKGLNEGDSVVISSVSKQASSNKTAQVQSPFMPKMPKRNSKN